MKKLNKTIPPAETFIINKLEEKYPNENRPPTPKDVEEWLIEFAEMHVIEALKMAYFNHHINLFNGHNEPIVELDEYSILTAYPSNNIQ